MLTLKDIAERLDLTTPYLALLFVYAASPILMLVGLLTWLRLEGWLP